MSPTARARYRRRPVFDLLARGMVERSNPGTGGPGPESGSGLLLVDASSFLLLTDSSFLLLAN